MIFVGTCSVPVILKLLKESWVKPVDRVPLEVVLHCNHVFNSTGIFPVYRSEGFFKDLHCIVRMQLIGSDGFGTQCHKHVIKMARIIRIMIIITSDHCSHIRVHISISNNRSDDDDDDGDSRIFLEQSD